MSGALIARRVSGRVTQSWVPRNFFLYIFSAVAIFLLPSPLWSGRVSERERVTKKNEGHFCVFDNLLFCKH